MFGIPKQTPESFLNTLKIVCSMHPEHISAYGLQIEEGTPFFEMRDTLPLPSEDEEYSMYVFASEFLREQGYQHYEISNFALRGKQCKHNLKYWNAKEYIGVGCAAHSFFGGERIGRTEDIWQYVNAMLYGDFEDAIESGERVTISDLESEYVMLRMRLSDGVDKREYTSMFGFDFDARYGEKLKKYVDAGFVVNSEERCAFTTDGMYISNTVLSSILEL
jgi:oxygen-independent coproporphyrinogen-3 oxidase